MARKRKSRKKDSMAGDLFGRLARAVIAILVLTAFVLAIAFGVKTLSSIRTDDLAGFASPYLSKIGVGEDSLGDVAGAVAEKLGDLDIEGISTSSKEDKEEDQEGPKEEAAAQENEAVLSKLNPSGDLVYTLAVIADSHIANDKQEYKNNKDHLRRALAQASELNADKVIHVGDLTNWGVLKDLREVKNILDEAELNYLTLPGDHDLAQSVGPENYEKVFGDSKKTLKMGDFKAVLLDNSANYTVMSDETLDWFEKEVVDSDFVIFSQPLFTDGLVLFNFLYMGSTGDYADSEALAQKQENVLAQRDILLELIRDSDVSAVVAGDHHKSSHVTDSYRGNLEHYVVGATAETVGDLTKNLLQVQNFTLLKVYENGGYSVEDIVLDVIPQ
ncbi:hypothetical protein HN803_04145 [candidate division WWE3 bacterium]|jgi:predicted phosphodiesterase|nr:hypothetical protein [candidate division WWE3 bacterium]